MQANFTKSKIQVLLAFLLLAGVAITIYPNSFENEFIFDDNTSIIENEAIHTLQWPWRFLENQRRPFLNLTLALNYSFGKENPFGYHVFNLAVHFLSAYLLFLIVWITCHWPCKKNIRDEGAFYLSLLTALIFLTHPLQTQSVTYVIQRAESLMGMFYLLTVLCAIHYFSSGKFFWIGTAALAFLLGGLTKEVAVTAPVLIFLYDRTFVSGTFKSAWVKHHRLYLALSLVWLAMLYLLLTANPEKIPSAGFAYKNLTSFRYALSQPPVILHYLRLVFWPNPLIFDYYWPPAKNIQEILPALLMLGTILVISSISFIWRFRVVGFLGLSFFLLLLPSSSFIPIKDLAFEHRMYLPIIPIILLTLLLARRTLRQRFPSFWLRQRVFLWSSLLLIVIQGTMTYQRNKTYQNETMLWLDVIAKQPQNARAFSNLGAQLLANGLREEAFKNFQQAMRLDPDYSDCYVNMGYYYATKGEPQNAITYFKKAISIDPKHFIAYNNLGAAYADQELYAEAIPYYQKALELGFKKPGVYHNLGIAFAKTGRPNEAIANIREALRLDPELADAKKNLDEILKKLKEISDAKNQKPDNPK